MNHRLVPLLWLFASCNGDDQPNPDDGFGPDLVSDGLVGDDDDDDSADSGPRPERDFEIYFLQVEATFGWDAESRAVIGVKTDYGEVPSSIVISLGDRRWARDDYAGDSEHYCIVVLPLSDPSPVPSWVAFDDSLYFGFDYQQMRDTAITDCGTEGYEYDPNAWGGRVEESLPQFGWGVAIGDLRPTYESNFANSPLLPHLVGGQINNTLLSTPLGEGIHGYVALASQIDASHTLVTLSDGTQPFLAAGQVQSGAGIASGLYHIMPLYIFTLSPGP